MPKILFLLLLYSISFGQTLANPIQIEKDILNNIAIKSFINEVNEKELKTNSGKKKRLKLGDRIGKSAVLNAIPKTPRGS